MNITLQAIPVPGATPITNLGASETAFTNDYSKLTTLTPQQKKSIVIEALIYSLTAAGGANYKVLKQNLRQDATVYTGALPKFDIWAAFGATAVSAANAADVTFPFDVETILANGRLIGDDPVDLQDRIIAFLLAQLGV